LTKLDNRNKMPKFKIIKGEGLEATIEKSEHKPTEFEVSNVKDHIEAVEKSIVEITAKLGMEKATVTNIENNYPGVKVLEEETKQACYLMLKSKMEIVPLEDKLKQLKDSMEEYKEELKELKDQTGIDIWKKKK